MKRVGSILRFSYDESEALALTALVLRQVNI
jgi:hypothetical protein